MSTLTLKNFLLEKLTQRTEASSESLRITLTVQRFYVEASGKIRVSLSYYKCEMTN